MKPKLSSHIFIATFNRILLFYGIINYVMLFVFAIISFMVINGNDFSLKFQDYNFPFINEFNVIFEKIGVSLLTNLVVFLIGIILVKKPLLILKRDVFLEYSSRLIVHLKRYSYAFTILCLVMVVVYILYFTQSSLTYAGIYFDASILFIITIFTYLVNTIVNVKVNDSNQLDNNFNDMIRYNASYANSSTALVIITLTILFGMKNEMILYLTKEAKTLFDFENIVSTLLFTAAIVSGIYYSSPTKRFLESKVLAVKNK